MVVLELDYENSEKDVNTLRKMVLDKYESEDAGKQENNNKLNLLRRAKTSLRVIALESMMWYNDR
jgi:hypothetical protein